MKKNLSVTMLFAFITVNIFAQFANQNLSNLISPTAVNVSLLPGSKNTIDIGSVSKSWKNLYVDGAIYMGGKRFIAYKIGSGTGNVAIGAGVMKNNSVGTDNTAVGDSALCYNGLGGINTAIGRYALYLNSSGGQNTATGAYALYSNTNGSYNLANGISALYSNISGSYNTAVGFEALYFNTSGYNNIAAGLDALFNNTKGNSNIGEGSRALYNNTTGSFNIAEGVDAMCLNRSGEDIIGIGDSALFNLNGGSGNCTAVGAQAGWKNTTGENNSYFGFHAGNTVTTGSSNTIIGYGADVSNGSYSNATALGNYAVADASNHIKIGNSSVTKIGGQVSWSTYSDARIKNNIQQNVPGLQFINLLNPVTYHYDVNKQDNISGRKTEDWTGKYDIEKIQFTGFIAQDVEAAAKKINYDFSGVDVPADNKGLYSLRYSDFVVPLVKGEQELSKQNDSLKSVVNSLQTQINELKAMIVSNQSTANSQQSTVLSSVSLSQNIPNPFSNSTTISYSIPKQFSSAKIIITDKNGNVLKQINLSGNNGSVNINASTLSSGAYQYSLYIDGRLIDTKQMILQK